MADIDDPRLLIKSRREELGLSQFKLWKQSGVQRSDISLLERCEIPIGPSRARKLEKALKLKMYTLRAKDAR